MTTYQTHRGALSSPEPYLPRRLPSTLGPACLADSITVARRARIADCDDCVTDVADSHAHAALDRAGIKAVA